MVAAFRFTWRLGLSLLGCSNVVVAAFAAYVVDGAKELQPYEDLGSDSSIGHIGEYLYFVPLARGALQVAVAHLLVSALVLFLISSRGSQMKRSTAGESEEDADRQNHHSQEPDDNENEPEY